MTEEKKKFGLGKGCLIIVGVFVGLGVIGAIAGGGDGPNTASSSATSDQAANEAAAVPPIEVTAIQLEQAYAENEAAAQQAYGDRPLLVTGKISKIDLDFADRPYLVLEGDNPFMGPQVKLVEEAQAAAASMKKGQKLTFRCESVSEVVGTPMLKDCSISEKP